MVVGEFTQETQLAVIGGGPAGYTAAFRAAELGMETVIIDPRETLGGVCLHAGCVPSKTLAAIAETIRIGRNAQQFGVTFNQPTIHASQVREWIEQTVAMLGKGLGSLAKKHNVEHIRGRAVFETSKTVAVRDSSIPRVKFRRAIVATGSSPAPHPALDFSHDAVWTPEDAVAVETIPQTLLVVGGDYLALELADFYAALGSRVTLVHEGDALLPDVDRDLFRSIGKRLKQSLEHIGLNTAVAGAEERNGELAVTFDGPNAPPSTSFERVIVSYGRRPAIDGLDLSKTDVALERDAVVVDEQMRTADTRIFAIGDVTGPPYIADRALAQGRIAGEVAAGLDSAFEAEAVPFAVFTDPELAWVGLSEQQASAEGMTYETIKQPWGASGRAVGLGRPDGMTKIIYEPSSELVLGIGLAGVGASELIGEAALAIEMGATLTDLAETIHPHPTRGELLSDACRHALAAASHPQATA